MTDITRYAVHPKQAKKQADGDFVRHEDHVAEIRRIAELHEGACGTVALMHAAAVGSIRGPIVGVVEDVEALYQAREQETKNANRWAREYAAAITVLVKIRDRLQPLMLGDACDVCAMIDEAIGPLAEAPPAPTAEIHTADRVIPIPEGGFVLLIPDSMRLGPLPASPEPFVLPPIDPPAESVVQP